jgi:hypothetical protein
MMMGTNKGSKITNARIAKIKSRIRLVMVYISLFNKDALQVNGFYLVPHRKKNSGKKISGKQI